MKAFTVRADDTDRFEQVDLDVPTPRGQDLLVKVETVSLNPVDTKVRAKRPGQVLGWDACGVVTAVGDDVTGFAVGDRVYYAGDITRPGSNAEYQLVDERIVGRPPESLDAAAAAALPLTALTAWEGLYEQLEVDVGQSILVIAAAGGVGSLVVQMAKRLSDMTVVGTASREETAAWARDMGADHVIDHRRDMPEQLRGLGMDHVDYVFCCYDTATHFSAMAEMLAPQGRIVSIVEAGAPLPIGELFAKKASFAWEFMFAKSLHQTDDVESQGHILDKVAELVDDGTLRSTLREDGGLLDAEKLARAHQRQAAGSMIGKQVFHLV